MYAVSPRASPCDAKAGTLTCVCEWDCDVRCKRSLCTLFTSAQFNLKVPVSLSGFKISTSWFAVGAQCGV
jgi:hypothetical protein